MCIINIFIHFVLHPILYRVAVQTSHHLTLDPETPVWVGVSGSEVFSDHLTQHLTYHLLPLYEKSDRGHVAYYKVMVR